jgi:hypothetical protein
VKNAGSMKFIQSINSISSNGLLREVSMDFKKHPESGNKERYKTSSEKNDTTRLYLVAFTDVNRNGV